MGIWVRLRNSEIQNQKVRSFTYKTVPASVSTKVAGTGYKKVQYDKKGIPLWQGNFSTKVAFKITAKFNQGVWLYGLNSNIQDVEVVWNFAHHNQNQLLPYGNQKVKSFTDTVNVQQLKYNKKRKNLWWCYRH